MESSKNDKKANSQYILVPPDGGWAYMIWIAAIINFSVLQMFVISIGIIFDEYYTKLEMGSIEIQVVNGVNAISLAVSGSKLALTALYVSTWSIAFTGKVCLKGFITGPMTKVLSLRKLSFIGSAFATVGVFSIVFIDSYALLILCQGVLMGAGTGVLYNVACTAMNYYFSDKMFMMTSLAQAFAAAAATVAPLAIHWTGLHYGYRAKIILMASVYLQTLVGSALQQPVKWHLKKIAMSSESEILLEVKRKGEIQADIRPSPKQIIDINVDQITPANNNGILEFIKDLFDWPFLKKFLQTTTCVGGPLGLVSDIMFTLFLPQWLYTVDWKEGEVAWALSLLSFGDIATRIFLIVASLWLKKVANDIIFIFGMILDIAAKLVLLWFPHPIVTYVTLTLTGCSRCLMIVLFSLVISDAVPPEKYATAFGVCVLMYGTFGITLGPAIGAVRDATGNYALMFYLLIGVMAAVTVVWCIELCRGKRKGKLCKSSIQLENVR